MGCNDLLSLTRPQAIEEIHVGFLQAGADIISTNTFNANRISLADYGLGDRAGQINLAAVACARRAIGSLDASGDNRPRFVAGSIGPTNRTASLSPDVNDPGYRAVSFDDLAAAYHEQVSALIEGGADILLPETTFDTLNLKACLFAIDAVFRRARRAAAGDGLGDDHRPQRADPFGADAGGLRDLRFARRVVQRGDQLRPGTGHDAALRRGAFAVDAAADELLSQRRTAQRVRRLRRDARGDGPGAGRDGRLRLAEHRRRLLRHDAGPHPRHCRAMAGLPPRKPPAVEPYSRYSGLEPLVMRPESNFTMIGERTNVSGSRKFARLVREGRFEEAVAIARQQVEGGANVIDVNLDDALLDGPQAMARLLSLMAAEPDVARVPVMIDSSRWADSRGRTEVRPGQVDRQLDQPQGGRGAFLAHARRGPPLRGRLRGDDVRRTRPGGLRRAQGANRPPCVSPAHGKGRHGAVGHHLRPQHPHRGHGHRGAQPLRAERSSRPRGRSSSSSPA
jgi:5-methyltetrahydrofolate--homocysteine methyltransferase